MDFSFFDKVCLPDHDRLFSAAEAMCDILENEKSPECPWRPVNSEGKAGGLLDFSDTCLPVILIPDLHARPGFLKKVCNFQINDSSVLELLGKKEVFLVFLGDALHSERTTKERWLNAYEDYQKGNVLGKYMKQEMEEGLSLLMMLFELKKSFPENFHFLKGNHENIMNLYDGGDFPFKKYANEGEMVKIFISEEYGDDVLYMLSLYERNLPLVFTSGNCIASHAEPRKCFTRKEIVDGRMNPEVVSGLVWTSNDEAENGSVLQTEMNILGTERNAVPWFGGHRPVKSNFEYRQNDSFIQIHNPGRENIVIVPADREFNVLKDIVNVSGGVYE